MFDLNKAILGNNLFVSENWVSNGSFSVKKILLKNSDDFYSEEIFKRLKTYKGINYDFNKSDDGLEKFISEKDKYVNVYNKTNIIVENDGKQYSIFECKEIDNFIFIDYIYVKFFNLEKLYGKKDSFIYIDDNENTNFFICECDNILLNVEIKKVQEKLSNNLNKFIQ